MAVRGEIRDSGSKPGASSFAAERMLPGLRTKLAGARRVAMRQVLVQRLRRIAARPDWLLANQMFTEMLSRASGNGLAKSLLESATLRAARNAEAAGDWKSACRFWVWNANLSTDPMKACKNLARSARAFTRERHHPEAVRGALEAWRFLVSIDSESEEGRQGVAWCNASLARHAEQEADFPAARSHWAAVLEVLPDDEAALEGIRRAIESGATIAPSGSEQAVRWRALQKHLTKTARPDYRSQCAAGQSLLTAGAPELAVPFLEQALRYRRTSEAALLLCRCQLALGRLDEAAGTVAILLGNRGLATIPSQELRTLLLHAAPSRLDNALLSAVCVDFAAVPEIVSAVMPLLVARAFREQIVKLTDAIEDDRGDWSESAVLDTATYLAGLGDHDRALRFLATFSGLALIGAAFFTCAERYEPQMLERTIFAGTIGPARRVGACIALAEFFQRKNSPGHATELLCQIATTPEDALAFYLRNKKRMATLIAELLQAGDDRADIRDRLARLIVSWVSADAKAFYASPEFAAIRAELIASERFWHASLQEPLGRLREHYFENHLERRENSDPDSLVADFGSCEIVLRYFQSIAELRPSERIPVSNALQRMLSTACLPLGAGRYADLLMSFAMFRERPEIDFKSPRIFERAAAWYLGRFAPANKIPSVCLSADVVSYFNAVLHDHAALGVEVTRFLHFLLSKTPGARQRYELGNSLDALLFMLESLPDQLASNPHYRPFFAAILGASDLEDRTVLDACVVAMSDPIEAARSCGSLSRLMRLGSPTVSPPAPAVDAALQDVVLIGHAGKGTGLSRNSSMLARGLKQQHVALATLEYEQEPQQFAEQLKAWRERCRSAPVVVAAVNAQDIPALFVRDRYDVLSSCYVAGFFLWETSQAPRVQNLGIGLVDEVWTPTKYVADVYAHLAPVHVVGKSLFGSGEWPQVMRHPPGGPIRFLTVFDFHSSIERKNPWASVAAFQKAFAGDERVELVIKASNVNPQHPGNALGQWERICAAAEKDRRIRIVAGRYTEEQMIQLMRATSCVVSLHRSEGFGYVLADALAHGVPVIATAYSGNVDFCDPETSFPAAYRLVPVKSHGAHWEGEGAEWADPDIDSAAAQMQRVYRDYPDALRKAAAGREAIHTKYSDEAFAATLRARLDAIRQSVKPRGQSGTSRNPIAVSPLRASPLSVRESS